MRTTIKWTDAAKENPPKPGRYLTLIENQPIPCPAWFDLDYPLWSDSNDYSVRVTHFALPEDITTEEDA